MEDNLFHTIPKELLIDYTILEKVADIMMDRKNDITRPQPIDII